MIGALIANKQLRSGFAAVARGDLDAVVSVFSDDAELNYPIRAPMQGKAAIRDFFSDFFKTFPKVVVTVHHICVENIFDFVGTNTLITHWEVATTNRRGETFKQTGLQVIETRFGKVQRMRYFFADLDHLRQAWKASE